jgi:hypothetical protein
MILSNDLAFSIGGYIGLFDLISLFTLLFWAFRERTVSTGLFALLISFIIGAITHLYGPYLIDWAVENPDYKIVSRFVWYMGFAFMNLFGIYAIRRCNQMLNEHAGQVARVVLLVFFTRGIITLARYTERLIWDTNYLESFYKTGIVSINAMSALTCLCMVIAYSAGTYNLRRGKRKEMWNI